MQEKEINVSRENKRVRSRLTKIPYTPLMDGNSSSDEDSGKKPFLFKNICSGSANIVCKTILFWFKR